MTWYPAYLDKQDIVDMVDRQSPTLTTDDIRDVDVKLADLAVWRDLNTEGIEVDYTGTETDSEPDPPDIMEFLWAASLAYNLEFLSYNGVIHYTPGGLQETKFGKVTHQFMRMQPMFFLGAGLSNLEKIRPFRSYKQIAYMFTTAYIRAYNRDKGQLTASPVVVSDMTSRGIGFNRDLDYMDSADEDSSGEYY